MDKILKEAIKRIVEEESFKLGPNGWPLVGKEIENYTDNWANILEERVREQGYKIKLEKL